ncbi:MAG TPA: ABC transporter permease [Actinomycetota bacterium]|nr:ABC transporter permease [Actinomycetota bacterium]
MGQRGYMARKIFHAAITVLFVLTFNFFLFRVMPGDPVSLLARSERLTPADVAEQRKLYGLDEPLPQQYLTYLRATLTGQLGVSLRSGEPVSSMIGRALPPTVLLVGLGTLFAAVFGVLIGIRGAWHRGSRFDNSTLLGSLLLYSVPEGWLGMLLLIVFAGWLGWFPAGGYTSGTTTGFARVIDIANHLVLPLLTLTLGYIGEYVIIMRSSLLEVMHEEFLQTARAKGVPERLVRRDHAVRNALLPTFSLLCLSFGYVLGGAIVIEAVFSWPGLGRLTYDAINQLDYPVLEGVFLIASIAVIMANLVADLSYGYLDPRIRAA